MQFWACLILVCGAVLAPEVYCADSRADLVLPLTEEIGRKMCDELKGCKPPDTGSPQSSINPAGSQVLCGDVFGNGEPSALVEFSDGLGYCVWKKDHWEARGAWSVPVTWRPAHWQSTEADYLPITPVEKPFEALDFGGLRLVVVAGEVQKYYQQFYLLQFIGGRVQIVQTAMEKPEIRDGFLILDDRSGRRAIWGETHYFRAFKGRLLAIADWREDAPYDTPDEGWNTARIYNGEGQPEVEFLLRSPDDEKADFTIEIVRIQPGMFDDENGREKFATGTRYATLKFTPLRARQPNSNSGEGDLEYLFEKLTLVPRSLYPGSFHATQKLEELATVTVKGSQEAVKKLSPD